MKLIIAFCLVAVVVAAPPPTYSRDNVQITKYDNDNIGGGSYRFAFQQTDGTGQEQQGDVINEGREDESIVVKGYYVWTGPDNVEYRVNYIADDNGFQPTIDQGPGGAVPAAVVASLLG